MEVNDKIYCLLCGEDITEGIAKPLSHGLVCLDCWDREPGECIAKASDLGAAIRRRQGKK